MQHVWFSFLRGKVDHFLYKVFTWKLPKKMDEQIKHKRKPTNYLSLFLFSASSGKNEAIQSWPTNKSTAIATFISQLMNRCLLINRFVDTVWPTFYSLIDNQSLTYWLVPKRKYLFLSLLVSFWCQSRTWFSMMDLERAIICLSDIHNSNLCWYPPAACQCWGKWNR